MASTFFHITQPNVSIRHVFVTSREINREWDEDDENFVIGKFPELTREELNERLGAKPAEEYGAKAYHEEAVCTDWPVHRILDRLSELGYNVHDKITDSRGYHTWMLTKKYEMATVKSSSPVLVHAVVSHYSSTLMNKSCEGTFIGTTFPAMNNKEELLRSSSNVLLPSTLPPLARIFVPSPTAHLICQCRLPRGLRGLHSAVQDCPLLRACFTYPNKKRFLWISLSEGMAPKSKFVAGKPRVKIEVPPPAPAQPTWKRAWVVENGVMKLKWVEEEKPESPVAMRRPTPFAGKKALMFRRIPPSTYSGSVEQIDRRWKSKVVKFVQLDEEEEEQPPPPAAAAPPAESHWQLDPPDLEEMRAFGNALADFHREKNQSQNRMWFSAPEDIYKDMRAAQPVVDRALTQPATIKEMARFENDNALFRAISYALSSTEKFGAVVRDKVLDYYSQAPVGRRRRITNLQRGENGELPEVEAAARALDVNILVFKEEGAEWTCFSAHPEHPQDTQDVKKPTIALLLASSGHYEVILEVQ